MTLSRSKVARGPQVHQELWSTRLRSMYEVGRHLVLDYGPFRAFGFHTDTAIQRFVETLGSKFSAMLFPSQSVDWKLLKQVYSVSPHFLPGLWRKTSTA